MPYIKTTIKAGRTIEVFKTYSGRYGVKGIPRSENRKKTPEEMKKVNLRQAEKKLRILMNANFAYGDYHITLTYKNGVNRDPETAKKQLDKFIRQARQAYRSLGKEFKWIGVTEYENRRIHHHLVINSIDTRRLIELWPYGRMYCVNLDSDYDYVRLAAYFIKETEKTFRRADAAQKKRWRCSRNLVHPEPKREIIRSRSWKDEPTPKKGYYIVKDSVENGINPITGYPYQSYRMVLLDLPDIPLIR